jgi:hypothetical protein
MSYWKTKTEAAGEQVRRIAEPLVAFVKHPFAPDDPAERDERDPRRLLPNGTWAPRVEIHHFEDWP